MFMSGEAAKWAVFSRGGGLILTITKTDADVQIYDRIHEVITHRLQTPFGSNIGIFTPDEHKVLIAEYVLESVDLKTGERKKGSISQRGSFRAMDVSPDGSLLATTSGKLWQKKGPALETEAYVSGKLRLAVRLRTFRSTRTGCGPLCFRQMVAGFSLEEVVDQRI